MALTDGLGGEEEVAGLEARGDSVTVARHSDDDEKGEGDEGDDGGRSETKDGWRKRRRMRARTINLRARDPENR